MLFNVGKSGHQRRSHKVDKKTSVSRWHDKPRRPGAVLLLQPSSALTAVGTICVLFRLLRRCGRIAVSRAPHVSAPWVALSGVQDSGRHSSEDHWSSQAFPPRQGRDSRKAPNYS